MYATSLGGETTTTMAAAAGVCDHEAIQNKKVQAMFLFFSSALQGTVVRVCMDGRGCVWVLSSTKATTKAKNVAATITGRNEASDGSE